jgi:hypothetical protein
MVFAGAVLVHLAFVQVAVAARVVVEGAVIALLLLTAHDGLLS